MNDELLTVYSKAGCVQCTATLRALDAAGIIRNHTVVLDRNQLGAGLVVFVMIMNIGISTRIIGEFTAIRMNIISIKNSSGLK